MCLLALKADHTGQEKLIKALELIDLKKILLDMGEE